MKTVYLRGIGKFCWGDPGNQVSEKDLARLNRGLLRLARAKFPGAKIKLAPREDGWFMVERMHKICRQKDTLAASDNPHLRLQGEILQWEDGVELWQVSRAGNLSNPIENLMAEPEPDETDLLMAQIQASALVAE